MYDEAVSRDFITRSIGFISSTHAHRRNKALSFFSPSLCAVAMEWSAMGRATNMHGATSPHIGLDVFFFNSKTIADITKWYKTFSFPLIHSTPSMRLGSYLRDTLCVYIYIYMYVQGQLLGPKIKLVKNNFIKPFLWFSIFLSSEINLFLFIFGKKFASFQYSQIGRFQDTYSSRTLTNWGSGTYVSRIFTD